jgi:hypothetical protein
VTVLAKDCVKVNAKVKADLQLINLWRKQVVIVPAAQVNALDLVKVIASPVVLILAPEAAEILVLKVAVQVALPSEDKKHKYFIIELIFNKY